MHKMCFRTIMLFAGFLLLPALAQSQDATGTSLQKRWLFVWREMSDAKEVDRVIARLPRAKAAGYNGIVLSPNMPPAKAVEFREAARVNGLDIVAIVMGNSKDRNYMEGLPVQDSLFVVRDGVARHQAEDAPCVMNGDFEAFTGNHFSRWKFQDDEGVTTFVDTAEKHGGKASLRMESIHKNQHRHCRIMQPIKLQPYRQYHISVWIKTEGMQPADPEIKLLKMKGAGGISFQTFRTAHTQDWKRVDIVFNSMDNAEGNLYLGSWNGKDGKVWWDDLVIEEIGLVNVLRRPGCPVSVRAEKGTLYEEGKDFRGVVDPKLHPWRAFHEEPVIKLTADTRIREGERLRVSYYHSIIIYEDRLTSCVTEPKIFEEWRDQVKQANALLHPAAFLMSHDEMRVMNHCALCRSKNMTPGELLMENVRQAAQIIRDVRPDAGIWVWNDMFDPLHNAVDHFYAVNGTLKGSWKGLAKDVGIVNWHGGLQGKNCQFFADLGLQQILSGYYDSDENGDAIANWQSKTKDVPGIVGAMYTTWEDRYDAMDVWAKRAWGR
ncbi:MAG: carbohydrate binding domain-containing protein [bacterium]